MSAAVIHHRLRDIDVLEIEFGQQLLGALIHRAVVHAAARQRDLVAEVDVFRHRELRHEHQFLVNDHDACVFGVAYILGLERLAVPEDLPVPRAVRIHRRQHFHQRGFARAVLAAQSDAFTGRHLEVDPVERLCTAERLLDAAHFQQRRSHLVSFASRTTRSGLLRTTHAVCGVPSHAAAIGGRGVSMRERGAPMDRARRAWWVPTASPCMTLDLRHGGEACIAPLRPDALSIGRADGAFRPIHRARHAH